jgi:hypothetical protein
MSDEEEKPLDLRDKLALEILNGLLASDPTNYSEASGSIWGTGAYIGHLYASKVPRDQQDAKDRAEQLIRTAYMMADVMRKVRLTAFM